MILRNTKLIREETTRYQRWREDFKTCFVYLPKLFEGWQVIKIREAKMQRIVEKITQLKSVFEEASFQRGYGL